jgi:hypothetical protein
MDPDRNQNWLDRSPTLDPIEFWTRLSTFPDFLIDQPLGAG